MDEEQKYDLSELRRLWRLNYQKLSEVPGEPNARIREARFVMQVKQALETRNNSRIMAVATVIMSLATIAMAIGTIYN